MGVVEDMMCVVCVCVSLTKGHSGGVVIWHLLCASMNGERDNYLF